MSFGYCRSCGVTLPKDKTYVRSEIWENGKIVRFIGLFCNYKCLDDYKMDRDLVVR